MWYDSAHMKIGVSGAAASFSEQAGERYIADKKLTGAEIVPLVRMDAVLKAVDAGEVDLGILAVQNSISGIVHSAVYAMSEYLFAVQDFFEIEIDQNILVAPGAVAAQIDTITSMRPALEQCTSYLQRVWPEAMINTYVDTATAAADLANGTLPVTTAVIASKRCATVYGLEILDESIQDLKHNYTTFMAVKKRS